MRLTQDQVRRMVALQRAFEKLIAGAASTEVNASILRRRSGADLEAFQQQVAADLKQGMSVAAVAEKYGVTPAYIYRHRRVRPRTSPKK